MRKKKEKKRREKGYLGKKGRKTGRKESGKKWIIVQGRIEVDKENINI